MALVGWNYYNTLTINGSSAGAQNNYKILVKVYSGSDTDGTETVGLTLAGKCYANNHANSDFSDLRFTNTSDTLLDYWIENEDTAASDGYALCWVEVDTIPASPDTKDIYVYYGNAGASSLSNGYNTFDVFADFNDGTTDGFTTDEGALSNPSTYLNAINTSGGVTIGRKGTSFTGGYSVASKVQTPTGVTVREMGIIIEYDGVHGLDDCHTANMFRISNTTSWNVYLRVNDSAWSSRDSGTGTYATNTWYKLEIKALGGYHTKSINDTVVGTPTVDSLSSGYAGIRTGFNENRYYDDFRARAIVTPEPEPTSWSGEISIIEFYISSTTALTTPVVRTGDYTTVLRVDWHDNEDLAATVYLARFWVRDSSDNTLGPYDAEVYEKEESYEYNARYTFNPSDTIPLGLCDLKSEVTK